MATKTDVIAELRATITEQQSRISQLEMALADTESLELGTAETLGKAKARIKALEDALDKLAECKRDAERYRWLRHALSDRSNNGKSHHFCSISSEHPEELDEAIDAAIAAMGEKK